MPATDTGREKENVAEKPDKKGEGKEAEEKLREVVRDAEQAEGKGAVSGGKRRETGEQHLPGVTIDGADGDDKPRPNAKVETDEHGRVTKVAYGNGQAREFKYGPDGKLVEMKDGTGTWKSQDGVNWTNEKGEKWAGTLQVEKDGSYSEKSSSGREKLCNLDGSVIRKDPEGRITEVTTADGKKRSFEYGPDGKINKLTDAADVVWTTSDGQSWTRQDTKAVWKGTVAVKADGTYEETGGESGRQRISTTDGRIQFREKDGRLASQEFPDGSRVAYDEKGRISQVKTARGEIRRFERAEDGKVTRILESSGTEWTSKDGRTFVMAGADVKVTGRLSIGHDGSYSFHADQEREVRRNADGSVSFLVKGRELTRTANDGSAIAFNEKGQVTDTTDASGQKRSFGYDAQGRVNRVMEPDGSIWETSDGKHWQKRGSRETRGGEVKVGPDGSYSVTNGRGQEVTFKLDGTQITRNPRGQVESVKYADGKERRFNYDASGNINSVREPNGTLWTSTDGKNWSKHASTEKWQGTISVDRDGVYREKSAAGVETVRRTDGWKQVSDTKGNYRLERENSDGTTVVKDKQGQVTEIRDSKGASRKFEYDGQGRMTKISEPTGAVWTSKDGLSWTREGNGEKRSFRVDITDNGMYRERHEDGRERLVRPDGASLTRDGRGRVVESVAANGKSRAFEYGPDGKISKVVDSQNGTWTTTDGHNWRKEGSDKTWKGTVAVRPDGTYEEKSQETGNKTIHLPDGRSAVYDRNNKLVKAESADGQATIVKYDESGKAAGFELKNKDGSAVTLNEKGQVLTTRDASGNVRSFAYGPDGKVNEVKDGGKVWKTTDGQNWTSDKGDKWSGQVFVTKDGQYAYTDAKGLVIKQLDGNTLYRERSGATRLENAKGQIVETVDAKGHKRNYEYNEQGQITKFNDNGMVWETKDGSRWIRKGDNAVWNGTLRVEKDGTYYQEDSGGNRSWRKPDGSREDVNYAEMEAACKAINDATYWTLTEGGTNEAQFHGALEGKSARQRQMMDEIYQRKYGKSIEQEARDEMEGHDLEKAIALIKKGDGADNAGTIRVALVERGQIWEGRSDKECERVVRDTLETMSAAEIAEADRQYRERYGQSLHDAVLSNPDLSEKTKEACRIYLKGHDQRTPDEALFLAKRACENGDATMFQEIMRRAPKEARDYFATAEGQQKMKDAFEGHWYHALTFGATGNVTDTELQHVKDYAEFGKLSVATQVKDNTSWLGDNEQAIEQALAKMSDKERQDYMLGKQIAAGQSVPADVPQEQKDKALAYYNNVSSALKDAAGKWFSGDSQTNEFAKWEDMIAVRGGSLVSRLADHRGHIYDSSLHDVISSVENMGEQDWQRLKHDPTYRGRLDEVLKTYLNDEERARAMAIIDQKAKADTFEASQQNRRPILDAIEDNIRWYNNKEDNIYRAIENMTKAEQEAYRNNTDGFKDKLDAKLRSCLDADEQPVAFGLLAKVEKGEKPEMAIMDKLNLQASYVDADEAQVIRDIQEAFKKDPTLQQRLANPQSEEDRRYAEQFKDAARRAMGSGDYERYAAPLIRDGKLSVELQMELNRGVFDDDEQGSYRDIQNASEPDKQRILTDTAFQERVLGHLSREERQIAIFSMTQGEMRPEDKLRSYMVGAGTSEEEIKQVFAEIRNRDTYRGQGLSDKEIDEAIKFKLDQVRAEYARKYGQDLAANLIDELGGKDLKQVERQLHQRSAREEFLFAQEQASESRSGFGSGLVDAIWDGTGLQMDDDRNALARAMVMEPDKVKDYADQLYTSIDLHSESREAMADAIVDTTIAAAAVAGAFFTGGVSLSLLAYTGLAGAAFKVGAKGAIMGADYDWSSSQVLLDGGTGFIDAATSLWGGGMLAVGRRAGIKAAQETVEAGGKALLREGAEAAFKQEAAELVVKGLQAKAKGISDDAIKALALKYAKEGQSEALEQMLKQSLTRTVKEESIKWLKNIATEVADNALAGAGGAYASGLVRAGFTAKDFDQFMQISTTSAAFGAFGGAAFTLAAKPVGWGAGKIWSGAARGADKAADDLARTGGLQRASHETVKVGDGPAPHTTPDAPQVRERGGQGHGDGDAPAVHEKEKTGTGKRDGATDDGAPAREGDTATVKDRPDGTADKPEATRAKEELEAQQRRLDEAEARLRDKTPIPEKLDLQKLKELSEEISVKFRDKPITREQFEELFARFSPEDRKIAMELMEGSMPNLTNRGIDTQMQVLGEELRKWDLRKIDKPDGVNPDGSAKYKKVDTVKIYVLDGTTDGNALAHLFHKNTGIEPTVEILDGPTLEKLQRKVDDMKNIERQIQYIEKSIADGKAKPKAAEILEAKKIELAAKKADPDLQNVVIFDNLGKASDAQRGFLKHVDNLMVADQFSRGLNVYDLAGAKLAGSTDGMHHRLAELVGKVKALEQQGLSRQDAMRRVLSGDSAALRQEFPNAQLANTREVVPTRRELRKTQDGGEAYEILSMYDELTKPMATPEQIQDFLGRFNAEQQLAAARFLRDGVHYQSYATMLDQAKQLHQNLLKHVPGGDPANMLIITGMESSGSSYLVNHLYSRVNGLKPENFVSVSDLRALQAHLKNGGRPTPEVQKLMDRLKGKKLVFIDDYAASGNQVPKILNNMEEQLFSKLVDKEGRRIVDGITVGTLGRYRTPEGKNPWDNALLYPHLHPGKADSYLPVTLVESPSIYTDVFKQPDMLDLAPVFETMGGTGSIWTKSPVRTAIVTPYGGPNNNPNFLQAFIELREALGLPRRYPDYDWWKILMEGPPPSDRSPASQK
jgi:YD repeat-containing protein